MPEVSPATTPEAWRQDFFAALRRLDASRSDAPRMGTSLRRHQDPVRLCQPASLDFAPSTLASMASDAATGLAHPSPPRWQVRFFGLWGPQGPLPLHLTELARERAHRVPPDRALEDFADLFHHRLLCLLHRARVAAHPAAGADRLSQAEHEEAQWRPLGGSAARRAPADPFGQRLASLSGAGAVQGPAGLDPRTARGLVAWRAGHARTSESIAAELALRLGAPVRVRRHPYSRLAVPPSERLVLRAHHAAALGRTTVLGESTPDATHTLALRIGPLTGPDHARLAPGGDLHRRARALVRQAIGPGLQAQVALVLRRDEAPTLRLGGAAPAALGVASWLGALGGERDPDNLVWID